MCLLDWQAIAIAACPNNIHAETVACERATLLAAEWYAKLAPEGNLTVVIQGDILPLIQYLNHNARLRYAGLQQHLISIKQTALHQLPTHSFSYLPREGNAVADHLAGVGADIPPPAKPFSTRLTCTTYRNSRTSPSPNTHIFTTPRTLHTDKTRCDTWPNTRPVPPMPASLSHTVLESK